MNLVKVILGALAASGLPASRLELEITESVLLEADPRTLAVLHELHALGIRIVMDDFGTGFSSLNYLRSFPFDKIKIDKSFVDDMSKGGDSVAIVKAIIDLARALKIEVVAEGVETEDQRDRLVAEGCTEMQGYLFQQAGADRELRARSFRSATAGSSWRPEAPPAVAAARLAAARPAASCRGCACSAPGRHRRRGSPDRAAYWRSR